MLTAISQDTVQVAGRLGIGMMESWAILKYKQDTVFPVISLSHHP
jgi:hypothetical protein